MTRRRTCHLLAAIALVVIVSSCASGVAGPDAAPTAEVERATPPPTAYIGAIAVAQAPSVASPPSENGDGLARGTEVLVVDAALSAARVTSAAPSRSTGRRARMVDRGPAEARRVALTFDAGADRGYAEQILDTLRVAGVQASFGMTGQWAEANPDLLRRMVAEGHHLINHTQTHESFTGFSTGRAAKSSEARARELDLTEQAVQRIAHATTKPYFRPPYGDVDGSVAEDVQAQGYEIVAMWTVDSLGWRGLSRVDIEARCVRLAAPGAVYVFHVGSAAQDGPALAGVIDGLRRAGYQMGTLDWLLQP